MSALTRTGVLCGALFTLALTACAVKVNGKSYGPSSGSTGSSGSSGNSSAGARSEPSNELPPVHPVPGMRSMGRLSFGADVYWFDIPKEAVFRDPGGSAWVQTCANVPAPEHWVADTVHWEPYGEHGNRKKPAIPDMTGEPLASALKRLDELDAPLCVFVAWDESCEREPGTVCGDSRTPDINGSLRLTVAGRHPR